MTVHLTYGTTQHTVHELARLIVERAGIEFIEHDSFFRGEYLHVDIPTGRIEIQANAIPGDDGQEDLYAAEHPTVPTLLLITATQPDAALTHHLDSIDGLRLLPDGPTTA